MNRTLKAFALTTCTMLVLQSFALTWTSPNQPDENTIALFRFDEGEGNVARSTDEEIVFNLSNPAQWEANPGWMEAPEGAYLRGAVDIGDKNSVGDSAKQNVMDWSLPAITISFWFKDSIRRQQENKIVSMAYNTWRNKQVWFGYRPGYSDASRLLFAGTGLDDDKWDWQLLTDGDWHHIAWVGVRDETGQVTLKYFIDNVQKKFIVEGAEVDSITFTPEYTSDVKEYWYLLTGCAGCIDELLIQGSEITDFSNGYNSVDMTTLITIR